MFVATDNKTDVLRWIGVVLLVSLFAIWPVQHTISIRDLLLVLALPVCGYLAWIVRPVAWWCGLKWPVGLYITLTIWIALVAFFISAEMAWSLDEIRGQWLKGMLALLLGGCAAYAFRQKEWTTRILCILFGVLLLHALYVDVIAIKRFIEAWSNPEKSFTTLQHIGVSPDDADYGYLTLLRAGWGAAMLTDGPDKSNFLSNFFLYFLLAETLIRSVCRRRVLPLSHFGLAMAFLTVLCSIYVERTRNGVLEMMVVLLLFGLLLFTAYWKRLSARTLTIALSLALLVLMVFGYISFKTDARWQSLWQTIPIALDTEKHRAWLDLNGPVPVLPDGEPVNRSNYMRIARIKAGIDLTLENPWGVGYGRNAFGHAVMKKYGVSSSHSHSGLVDMAIGAGIPGALLWLGFLMGLGIVAVRGYRSRRDFASVLLLFVVTGYGVRMVLDSIVRDHMLQMFLFLAAFLAVAVVREPAGARA